jgi:hypothetical protein
MPVTATYPSQPQIELDHDEWYQMELFTPDPIEHEIRREGRLRYWNNNGSYTIISSSNTTTSGILWLGNDVYTYGW